MRTEVWLVRVHNVHERVLAVPAEAVAPLLAAVGGPDDVLWPAPEWPPMVLDRPLGVGADGGHGPIRYRVSAYEPGRRAEFTFTGQLGMRGTHTFEIEPLGPDRTRLRHRIEGDAGWPAVLLWPIAVRFAHDTVVEQLLDRAEAALGVGPARPLRSAGIAALVALAGSPRAAAVAAPVTALLARALPTVDASDAQAVECRPGLPDDAQVWADAVFHDPPAWVLGLMALRQLAVGLVGIERGDRSSFDTVAAAPDGSEVLLGADAGHLDFRASVLCERERVVVTTVVRCHNARGRAYWALVRLVHPVVVRGMLSRAARTLSRSSNAQARAVATMGT